MQGIYWLLTIPHHPLSPYLPPGVAYIRGQLERGEKHWISPLAALPCFIQETTNWFHQETIGTRMSRRA